MSSGFVFAGDLETLDWRENALWLKIHLSEPVRASLDFEPCI